MTEAADEHYVVQHVREALAQDPRVGELELDVDVRAGRLFLTGSVLTEERRQAVGDVAREVCPELELHNQVRVDPPPAGEPDVEVVS
jgi:osmotically-inducible protein OsmY